MSTVTKYFYQQLSNSGCTILLNTEPLHNILVHQFINNLVAQLHYQTYKQHQLQLQDYQSWAVAARKHNTSHLQSVSNYNQQQLLETSDDDITNNVLHDLVIDKNLVTKQLYQQKAKVMSNVATDDKLLAQAGLDTKVSQVLRDISNYTLLYWSKSYDNFNKQYLLTNAPYAAYLSNHKPSYLTNIELVKHKIKSHNLLATAAEFKVHSLLETQYLQQQLITHIDKHNSLESNDIVTSQQLTARDKSSTHKLDKTATTVLTSPFLTPRLTKIYQQYQQLQQLAQSELSDADLATYHRLLKLKLTKLIKLYQAQRYYTASKLKFEQLGISSLVYRKELKQFQAMALNLYQHLGIKVNEISNYQHLELDFSNITTYFADPILPPQHNTKATSLVAFQQLVDGLLQASADESLPHAIANSTNVDHASSVTSSSAKHKLPNAELLLANDFFPNQQVYHQGQISAHLESLVSTDSFISSQITQQQLITGDELTVYDNNITNKQTNPDQQDLLTVLLQDLAQAEALITKVNHDNIPDINTSPQTAKIFTDSSIASDNSSHNGLTPQLQAIFREALHQSTKEFKSSFYNYQLNFTVPQYHNPLLVSTYDNTNYYVNPTWLSLNKDHNIHQPFIEQQLAHTNHISTTITSATTTKQHNLPIMAWNFQYAMFTDVDISLTKLKQYLDFRTNSSNHKLPRIIYIEDGLTFLVQSISKDFAQVDLSQLRKNLYQHLSEITPLANLGQVALAAEEFNQQTTNLLDAIADVLEQLQNISLKYQVHILLNLNLYSLSKVFGIQGQEIWQYLSLASYNYIRCHYLSDPDLSQIHDYQLQQAKLAEFYHTPVVSDLPNTVNNTHYSLLAKYSPTANTQLNINDNDINVVANNLQQRYQTESPYLIGHIWQDNLPFYQQILTNAPVDHDYQSWIGMNKRNLVTQLSCNLQLKINFNSQAHLINNSLNKLATNNLTAKYYYCTKHVQIFGD